MSSPGSGSKAIESIAVIGAGTMGHGIAQVAAAAGFRVLLNDVDRESLARGVAAIESNLVKGIQRGKLTEDDRDRTLQHIHGTMNLMDCAAADLIIEAAPEQLELKQEVLRQVESASDHPFIFASNTSSLSISEIASSSKRPKLLLVCTFSIRCTSCGSLKLWLGKRPATRRYRQSRMLVVRCAKNRSS